MSRGRRQRGNVPNKPMVPAWIWGLALVAIVILIYWPVFNAAYIWDDAEHLTENPCIVGPLGLKEIWTTTRAFYYPLVLTTFWIVHKLGGLNPIPYHLLNAAFHAASAIMLWRVLRLLNVRGAWLGAALWAAHPVMVQTVAWVTEMKNTQSTLFFLLSIFVFLRAERGTDRRAYLLSLFLFVCALTSKPATVMLPVTLALCIWWRSGKIARHDALRLAPFFLFSALASGWTIWEQKFHSGAVGREWSQTFAERIIIAGRDLWFYVGKLVWPANQSFIYPHWAINSANALEYVPAIAAVAGLAALWWKRNGMLRPAFVAASYFVVSLMPVLGFFNVYFFRYSYVSDHFQYLAAIGPLALAGAAIEAATGKFLTASRWAGVWIGVATVFVLAVVSCRHTKNYADAETLYRVTIERNPDCWLAYNNLGAIYVKRRQLDEAINSFDKALSLNPELEQARFNVAEAHLNKGEYATAEQLYEAALPTQPNNAKARTNYGVSLLGQQKVRQGLEQFEIALRDDPQLAEARYNIGYVLARIGQREEAERQLREALRLKPDYAQARHELESLGVTNP